MRTIEVREDYPRLDYESSLISQLADKAGKRLTPQYISEGLQICPRKRDLFYRAVPTLDSMVHALMWDLEDFVKGWNEVGPLPTPENPEIYEYSINCGYVLGVNICGSWMAGRSPGITYITIDRRIASVSSSLPTPLYLEMPDV